MSKKIFVAATMQNDGKTTVSMGLIMALKKRFGKVGFIKPIGQRYLIKDGYKVDEDSVLIEDICKIKCHLKDMSPIAIERGFTEWYIMQGGKEDLEKKIIESFNRISEEADAVVIEGTGHAGVGSCFDLSNAAVAKLLDAPVILVTSGGIGRPIDEIMLNMALFEKERVNFKGIIVNKVLDKKYEKIDRLLRLGLERRGIDVYGVMPYTKFLANPTVGEILERTKGRLICGEGMIDNVVEKILVGAMEPHEALHYVEDGSLIITPGDREDMILAAAGLHLSHENDKSISGIVLSGGLMPHDEIVELVKKTDIPVILTQGDTYSVASMIHDMIIKIKPKDKVKIETAIKLVEKYIDIDRILKEI
ncbi:MAG: AAA family ATPase [Candidatus Omnitrophica bacterium]|nr:AAA family ATPase [Candidatus Omnitrophota bacterium]